MKTVKRILYGICILIVLGCGGILVCAFNPSITQTLSAKLSNVQSLESGETVIEMLPSVKEDADILPEEAELIQEYVVPSQNETVIPEQVVVLTGYEPIFGQEEQIAEEEAGELKESLETGPTGANLSFDERMYPYYGMLNEEERAMYRQIYANASEYKEAFKPAMNFDNKKLKKVFEAVYNDHPKLFWLETAYSCKYLSNGKCLEITLKYNETIENITEAKQKFEARAKNIIAEADQFAKLDAKEKLVHDVLVEDVVYNANAAMGQSAYSALVNGQSVCAGYARAFQYLMQELGIPCYYCTGISKEDHAWNIIKMGGKYYNVDVTWDDTEPSTYDYYNKTDKEYSATHVRTGLSVKLPACVENASDDDTYVASGEHMKPLEWPLKPFDSQEAYEEEQRRIKQENLDKAKIDEEDVMDNLTEYYADCLKQMEKSGAGLKSFTNVIPQTLWPTVEQAYSQNGHTKGYVNEGLKKLKKENFAIQLQVEDINGGYYRLYHNISTW